MSTRTPEQQEAYNAKRRAARRARSGMPDGPPFPCPHCPEKCTTPQGWQAHVQRHSIDVTANSLIRSKRIDRSFY